MVAAGDEERAAAIAEAEQAVESALKSGNRSAEAEALLQLSDARLTLQRDTEKALRGATAALTIFKEIGNKSWEAQAQLCVCNAHLGRIALDAAKTKFPAMSDTMGAVSAAKAAYKTFSDLCEPEGKERASRALSNALLATGVPASTMPSPEALIKSKDLAQAITDCGGSTTPFQAPQLKVRNQAAAPKKPQSTQFERTGFRWRDPTAEYCYTMIWEEYKDANFATPKKKTILRQVCRKERAAQRCRFTIR